MSETKLKTREMGLLLLMGLIVVASFALFFMRLANIGKESLGNNKNISDDSSSDQNTVEVPLISAKDLQDKLNNKEPVYVLDVQESSNFNAKHIPGSISIPYGVLQDRLSELPEEEEIVATCAGSEAPSSCSLGKEAGKLLTEKGFKNVKELQGGIAAWEKEGFSTVSGAEFIYRNITADDLKKKIDDRENVAIIDVRDEEEYYAGHIKGAIHVSFSNVMDEITKIPRGKEIIVYDKKGFRSKLVVEELIRQDVNNVANLLDGLVGWKNKKYPLE